MRHSIFLAVPLVAISMVVGCDKGESGKQSQGNTSAVTAAHPNDAPANTPVTPPVATPAYPQASSGPGTASVVPPTTTTQPAAADQAAAVQAQLDQAMQYVKDKKYDLADKVLAQLDQQKATWPTATQQTYGPKIDMAHKALAAAKGGASATDAFKGAFQSK